MILIEIDSVFAVEYPSWTNGNGYAYVPDSLVTSYKSNASWQEALPNYNTQIKPLSEYIE